MKDVRNYIILGLVICILLMRLFCTGKKCPEAGVITKTSTVTIHIHDTTEKKVPVPKIVLRDGKEITIVKHDTVGIPHTSEDTAAIVQDYFDTRFYSDTIAYVANDSLITGHVVVDDSVSRNAIISRRTTFDFNVRKITNTITVPQRNKIFAGIDLGGTNQWIAGGVQLVILSKKDAMYNVGANYTTQNQFYFHAGTAWKIKLKK